MTTTETADSRAATTTATSSTTGSRAVAVRGKRPRWVSPLIVVGVLLVATVAVTFVSPSGRGNTDDLDPTNPGFSGARGLAQVLSNHGVRVTVVRSQRELLSESIDSDTTVVITGTIRLSGRTAQTALAHVASAASVVLLDPDAEVTRGMGLPVTSNLADLTDVAAACEVAVVGKDFRLAQASRVYTPTDGPDAATTCFPDKSGGGAMVSLAGAAGRPPMILLGDDTVIQNGAILDSDNAAIALHLFGQTNHLVWYLPSVADIAPSESSSRSIAPSWFQPGLALVTSAVVFLCLWRGRRLGRLVTEPLPVIVRAIETTESRGRMYRKARDRTRALAVLQIATRRRLSAYLGLPASSAVISVAAAAAAVSGRSYQDVLDLLSSSSVHDDSSLLEHANSLIALEKEVRRR